jgi:hypothetical protein
MSPSPIGLARLFGSTKKNKRCPKKRRTPTRCAPGVSEAMCLSAAYAPHCTYAYGKRSFCRRRTNKRKKA